jgi:sulfate adenylyltransferase
MEPHGGMGLVNRFVKDRDKLALEAIKYRVYNITDADYSVFYRIADGTLSPLIGPMGKDEFDLVLDKEYVIRNERKFAWTIPIVFMCHKSDAYRPGETLAVKDTRGVIIGTLKVTDFYPFDKKRFVKSVYGTERTDHPGPRIIVTDERDYCVAGEIQALPDLTYRPYQKYMLSPVELRELFKKNGWERIVAFQTRNPLHRAHEYAMVYALEQIGKSGHKVGVVLNPLVGATKSDDIPPEVRMRTYEALLDHRLIGHGDKDMGYWHKKGHDICDNIILIGLDMKMFYAGPKEAIMHAIYRQNNGFTDQIIGRKHADAPFDDKTPAWGDFDAQVKFDHMEGELLIQPFKVGNAAYVEELGRVDFVEKFKGNGFHELQIAGSELRRKLQAGEPIDERIMRKPVSEILRESYRENIGALRTEIKSTNITWHDSQIKRIDREKKSGHKGVCIWLTGLSASGKSTIANSLQSTLFAAGCNAYVLDGDNIRHGLNKDLGFNPKDREENIRRIAEVARLFSEAGFIIVTAFISPYRQDRDNARSIFPKGDFYEVFVKASLNACENRDPKNLYKKARKGEIKEFTGVSAPYEEPIQPEITVDTEKHNVEGCVKGIVAVLKEKGIIEK